MPIKINAGNLTDDGNMQLVYNNRNRLSEIYTATDSVSASYNAKGERVLKIPENHPDHYFVYDESGKLFTDYTHDKDYQNIIWLDDTPIAIIKASVAENTAEQIFCGSFEDAPSCNPPQIDIFGLLPPEACKATSNAMGGMWSWEMWFQ